MEEIKKFLAWLTKDSKYHGIEFDGLIYFGDWNNEDAYDPNAPLKFNSVEEVIAEYMKATELFQSELNNEINIS